MHSHSLFKFDGLQEGWRKELSEDELIAGLRCYISKNTAIPQCYQIIDQAGGKDNVVVKALLRAIEAADFDAEVFSNPMAQNHILYMVEKKIIPYWQGMSAYVYVMFLAQFSDKQKLRPEDTTMKVNRPYVIHNLVNAARDDLSEFGQRYLRNVIYGFSILNVTIDSDSLKKQILALPSFEQRIIELTNTYQTKGDAYYAVYDLLDKLKGTVVFCLVGDKEAIFLPSTSLINIFLSAMNDKPMQMLLAHGTIGEKTKAELHAKDQHMVQLYNASVKSNLTEVHGRKCGPIPAYLHDVGHAMWASLLSLQERAGLQVALLPALKRAEQAASGMDPHIAEQIGNFSSEMNDYNLTPLKYYRSQADRFAELLRVKASFMLKVNRDNYAAYAECLLPEILYAQHQARMVHSDTHVGLRVLYEDIEASVASNKMWAEFDAKRSYTPPTYPGYKK